MKKLSYLFISLALIALAFLIWERPERSANDAADGRGKKTRIANTNKVDKIRRPKKRLKKPQVPKGVVIDPEDEAIAALDREQRQILDEIIKALESEDFKALCQALDKMRSYGRRLAENAGSADWTRYVPDIMRMKAVEALGNFGGGALAELVQFLADPSADVMQSAMDQFELAISDFALSDREKAEVIKLTCQVVNDAEFIDWMLTEAQEARHSVGIETLFYIKENGTDTAKSMVQDAIDFFTGEENIDTEEAALNWLEVNPDDDYDDDIYGGIKEE